jgi:lysozyme
VRKLITVSLTEFQEAALISFTYNLGAGNLGSSTLRTLLNEGHVDAAAGEFLKWVRSNGQRVKGLIRRRGAEQAVFEGKVPFGPQLPKMLDQFADAALAAHPV